MSILGWKFEIWIYWVFHLAMVVIYGIYILTRKDHETSSGKGDGANDY